MEQKKELTPEELEKAGGGRHHGDLVRVKCECGKTTTGSPSAFPCTCTCGKTLYAPREY